MSRNEHPAYLLQLLSIIKRKLFIPYKAKALLQTIWYEKRSLR